MASGGHSVDRRRRGGGRGAGGRRAVRAKATGQKGPPHSRLRRGRACTGGPLLRALRRNGEGREGNGVCRRGGTQARCDFGIRVRPPPEARGRAGACTVWLSPPPEPHPSALGSCLRASGQGVSAEDTPGARQGTTRHRPGDGGLGL